MPCTLILPYVNNTEGAMVEGDTLYPLFEADAFSQPDEEMSLADSYVRQGDYNNAQITYSNIVEEYPDSTQAFLASTQLFKIKKLQNSNPNDYENLNNFYENYKNNVSDTILQRMIENLKTLCYIGKEDYETAMGRLEDIINQYQGEEESVYAEIDLLTTAMIANSDTGSTMGKYSGRYAVSSIEDYGSKLGSLLAKLGSGNNAKSNDNFIPVKYNLYQNYPNPFNPTTSIKFDIPKTSNITLKIYDILGREVATLVNEEKTAGSYTITFNASKLASGIYFYRLTAGSFNQTKKLVLLK